jgi:hypothetical protein
MVCCLLLLFLDAAAEIAVHKAGGLKAVLQRAGVVLPRAAQDPSSAHHSLYPQLLQHQQQHLQSQQGKLDHTHHHQEQQQQQQGGVQQSGAHVGSGGGPLADGPEFKWGGDDEVVYPLAQYEVVREQLARHKPPLLGKGSTIPPATLEVYRWGKGEETRAGGGGGGWVGRHGRRGWGKEQGWG